MKGPQKLCLQTENAAVARKYFTLLQKTFNIETELSIREKKSREERKGIFCGNSGSGADTGCTSGDETFGEWDGWRNAFFGML